MNRRIRIFATFFILVCFAFNEKVLSWEAEPTHKDITSYAANNSVLSTNGGDYLKNIGFINGLYENLTWNASTGTKPTQTILEWLQEGSALEDEGNIWQLISSKGRFNKECGTFVQNVLSVTFF